MFLTWGSGRKSKNWHIGDSLYVVCVYRYAHIMFILRWVTGEDWYLQGDRRSDDRMLTKEEVLQFKELNGVKISAYPDWLMSPSEMSAHMRQGLTSRTKHERSSDNEWIV